MGVQTVYRVPDERLTGEIQHTEMDVTYLVAVDDVTDGPEIAYTANDGTTAIPLVGTSIGTLVLNRVEVSRSVDSPTVYTVRCSYSTASLGEGSTPETTDPAEKWDIDISVSAIPYSEPVWKDTDDVPVVNSAGQPFDPTVEVTKYDENIKLSFKTRQLPATDIKNCRGKTNSSPVNFTVKGVSFSYPTETLLFNGAEYSTSVYNNETLWTVTYDLINRTDDWRCKVLDQGLYEKVGTELRAITDKHGQYITSPHPLSGGTKLASGSPVVLLNYRTHKKTDFAPLFAGL
jgi:hypothetical protein